MLHGFDTDNPFFSFLLHAKIAFINQSSNVFSYHYIKNSPQYLKGFYLFLDHNKSGLSGSDSNANEAYT